MNDLIPVTFLPVAALLHKAVSFAPTNACTLEKSLLFALLTVIALQTVLSLQPNLMLTNVSLQVVKSDLRTQTDTVFCIPPLESDETKSSGRIHIPSSASIKTSPIVRSGVGSEPLSMNQLQTDCEHGN